MRLPLACLGLVTLSGWITAAPLRIDFSIPARADAIAPGYEQWAGVEGRGARKSFGAVTLELQASQGGTLGTIWWKGGAEVGSRMCVDGVSIGGRKNGGSIQLRLHGLTPGRHTLAAFHNFSAAPNAGIEAGPFDVLVDGVVQVQAARASVRAGSDDQARATYVEFETTSGRDTVVEYRADADVVAAHTLVLCGLELDGSNPLVRARQPVPADRDEHVAADDGRLRLAWTSPGSGSQYRVFVGEDAAAVASAPPDSALAHAVTADAHLDLSGLSSLRNYHWRVDTIGSDGRVTSGVTWSFRLRHLAFPGAEGYGRFARGGRGGRVIEVTNLNDSGPGSLRAAVEADGPRTVVFSVSGLITLRSKLVIKNPYITVAGQTAPGKGITLRQYNFGMMGARDAVVRFVRVRPGNISGTTLDGMGMATCDHTIVDHASISWTLDEAFSSRGAENITLQRTLISEALNQAGHKNYPPGSRHGYAASISGKVGSFHHNLLAHNSGRNWSLAGGLDRTGHHTGWLDLRNNVVYNWDNRTTDGGAAKVNFVANYYKPGPASRVFHLLKPERNNIQGFGPQDYYVSDNVMEGHVGADDAWGGIVEPTPERARRSGDRVADHDDAVPSRREPLRTFVKEQPFFAPHVTTQSARLAYKLVLSDVGCAQPTLDDHDVRVIRETLDGTFTYRGSKTNFPGLPDSQEDVGGWEDYPEVHRAADFDRDHDGLPDWWEGVPGLNPRSPAGSFVDANADADGDGYTNLDDYLAWLAQPHVECAVGGAVEVDLAALSRGFTKRPVHAITRVTNGTATVAADGHTLRFTAAPGVVGLGEVAFAVTDADGDHMERTIGIAILSRAGGLNRANHE